jgi:S1-C subfamily serine protease
LVSTDGYIVTNKHVIDDADKVEIILNDRREFLAEVVGSDIATDLAVLKINVQDVPHLAFGNSDEVQVGEWVLAVGNPLKLSSTVTAGIISAKGRSIELMGTEGIESFLQTDAAVNPGNSGGALVNTAGKLIGINTAILTKSGGYEGFSFAVPINLASKIIADIIEYGAVQRGWMGVRINNVDASIANDINLVEVNGVLLSGFTSGSAAKDAGLVIGDVIVGINDVEIGGVPEFTEQVGRYRPGDILTVIYLRDNKRATAEVTLKNNLNTTDFVAVRKDKVLIDLGIEIRDMDSSEKTIMQLSGAYVVSVYAGSTIDQTNLEPGFIVTMANQTNIQSADDLVTFLKERKGTVVLEGYYQNYPGKFPYTFDNK